MSGRRHDDETDEPGGSTPDRTPAGWAEGTEDLPPLEARSVMFTLDRLGGRAAGGVRLAPLAQEVELPPIRMGSEKYQIVKLLGRGGMGKVYLAYDRDLNRHVAIKLTLGDDPLRDARFLDEAQVMGQLQHPNIVDIYELGLTKERRPYYTMPEVRGQTLRSILDGLSAGDPQLCRAYSRPRLVQVFLQVANALSYAHDKGVIHRDVKPSNIMLGEHGEVQVLDWGLSQVFAGGALKTDLSDSPGDSGRIVGTPDYMAPEQARGELVDARVDVYALGVLLYEMLTLRRPFEGTPSQVLAAVLNDRVVPPRERAPERDIPLDLEQIALTALSKEAELRQRSAHEVRDEVQSWLETETDRDRRRERAEREAQLGEGVLRQYAELEAETVEARRELEALRDRFEAWQPAAEKRIVCDAEDALALLERRVVETGSTLVATLGAALAFDSGHARARELLADYYWARFGEAETAGDELNRAFFGKLVANFHDGKYARALRGDGSLALDSNPPGAEVWLYECVSAGFVLEPRDRRLLGRTPLGPVALPMGSYLAVVSCAGFRDVRYPVFIARSRDWSGLVELYTEQEIGPDFVYVPAGPFIQGGDRAGGVWSLPRAEPHVDAFFIARHPVTMAEYLDFLNALRLNQPEAAARRGPRSAPDAPTYLVQAADGAFELPGVDAEGDRWEPGWPVVGVSWDDAVAYCAWRSERDGRELRLPSETEWEKAARGVDGRAFPWGNRFDPSLANMLESRAERPSPAVVDDFPHDVSIYGVRGMAGNCRDWTGTERIVGRGARRRTTRVVRGGAWNHHALHARCATGTSDGPATVLSAYGFRLAASPPRRSA